MRKRLVCYLSGFDPQGPAHYHQLYATEAAKQGAVSGYHVQVGKRRKLSDEVATWSVTGEFAGETVETRYDFLRWDDIVREHWPRSRWGLFKATAVASWQMWRNGVMWYSWRRSWPMFAAIAAPGVLMVLLAMAALGLLACAFALQSATGSWLLSVLSLCIGLPLLGVLGRVAEARTHMAWLMRSLACLVKQGRGETPSLDARLDALSAHLAKEWLSEAYDEVLVVGHSSGAMMAQIVTAQAIRLTAGRRGGTCQPLQLLTLGHCSPLLSAQPEAVAYREHLVTLCESFQAVHWIDVSAPPDGCCFALVDPTEGLRLPDGAQRPRLLNPRFAQAFSPERYQEVRSDKFRCHFQYLMASELPSQFDYVAITAGPQTLLERFDGESGVRDFRQFTCFGGPPRR